MKKILVASTNKKVVDAVKTACDKYSSYFDPAFFSDTDEALGFIDYELPEIKVLDFTSVDIDSHRIIATISADPWLHNGGIVAVVKNPIQVQEIEATKDPNILIVQTEYNFTENFTRLLRILWANQHFLFNRGMQDTLGGHETGSFVCGNDPMDFRIYTTFLVGYLYSTNRITDEERYNLQTALMELLTNALEHGNCNISYEEKTNWLMNGGNILSLIEEKNKDPEIANRKIHIAYAIGKTKSKFVIRDEGNGFDWKNIVAGELEEDEEMHGRGILISKEMVRNLSYNDIGNEVSFEVKNLKDAANSIPGIMVPFSTMEFTDKQVVCRENEPTNDLYFIVSGRFAVYSGKKLVSVLTPADMFIGEMAFLLNDSRSATVLSIGDGKLIRIPKNAFLNLIRKNPHYGIFLSKLLAQRLRTQTQKIVSITNELNELKALGTIPDTFEG
ncbi:MAG: cyclic nucleotide-binding domain-containing protein [Spirochaetaceae bacterium]|nr:cyclic nucleotide-binding domain-containing protein [Spirochaetaceae bacterium]